MEEKKRGLIYHYVIVAFLLGGGAECIAFFLNLWTFTPWWYLFTQVLFFEGIFFGILAYLTSRRGFIIQALVGGGIGFISELLNAKFFHLWRFSFSIFPSSGTAVLLMIPFWAIFIPLIVWVTSRTFKG